MGAILAFLGRGDKTLGVVTLSGEAVSNALSGVASLFLNADGTMDKTDFGGRAQIDASTDWIIPNTGASDKFDMRYTNHSGDVLDTEPAAEDVWVDCGSEREMSITGNKSCSFDIEIRDVQGITVASASYSLLSAVP